MEGKGDEVSKVRLEALKRREKERTHLGSVLNVISDEHCVHLM